MTMDNMLNIAESPMVDESIESYRYKEYSPQNPAAINSTNSIQIDVDSDDIFIQPSRSFLLVEGVLESSTGTAYIAASKVSLTNNAIPFLFSQIRYLLNGKEIEEYSNPGQVTTMMGLLVYGDDFSEGLNMCWQKDTTSTADDKTNLGWEARRQMVIAKSDPVGTFSFCVPLKHLFGFCDDYHKIMYGLKHSLMLSKQSVDEAIFHAADVPNGKITLTKLGWYMPVVTPDLAHKKALYDKIMSKVKIPVAFRAKHSDSVPVPRDSKNFCWSLATTIDSEKPRWLLVAFQTGRSESQSANPALFDNLRVRNIYVKINSERYPNEDMNLSFPQMRTSLAYSALRDFKEDYWGIDGRESSNQITPIEFVDRFTIFVFDLRRQSEKLKTATQKIVVHSNFDVNPPVNTTAYALLISDKMLQLDSDGGKFGVIV
jgi:hypothetical protein